MTSSPVLIDARGLSKDYRVAVHRGGLSAALASLARRRTRTVHALRDVSFRVAAGELVGYLGPNGAGKSTTVKILSGVLVPTAGTVTVGGWVPWADRSRYTRDIGVVFGQRTSLWWDLPTVESFELLRHMYRIPSDRYRDNLNHFRRLLDLDAFMHAPVRTLSLGQRMRAELVAAFLHDPSVVFLDEPTIGLDVVAKQRIREFVLDMNRQRGVTVILTTHDLGDVERLCPRVLMIDRGRRLFDGALATLQERFGGERELIVDLAEDPVEVDVPDAEVVRREERRVTLRFSRDRVSASELIGRVAARYRVADLTVRDPDVESTIRRIYEQGLLEEESPEG